LERKLTIVIAQKYYDPGYSFREVLEKSGYHAVSLSGHSEIFEFLAQKRVDMVIVGITTTIEYCESIMRQIKKMNLKIPVIVVSSFQDIRGKEKLIELGVQEWIYKPFDMEYVKRRVKEKLKA
jgi:DNA-binding NtrC family response regulator